MPIRKFPADVAGAFFMSLQDKLLDYLAGYIDTLACCEHRTVKYAERARVLFLGSGGLNEFFKLVAGFSRTWNSRWRWSPTGSLVA